MKNRTSRPLAMLMAAALGLAGGVLIASPATADALTPWDSFAAAYQSSSPSSIELTEDLEGTESVTLPVGKSLTIDLAGHSLSVTGTTDKAALGVPTGTTLTIRDTVGGGTLTAVGGSYSAGIGGSRFFNAGTINVNSGTIVATGKDHGAGIGAALSGTVTAVNISGGTVTAAAGAHAAGIGGTYNKAAGAVTISGGTVTATGGSYGAGLGAGETGTGGTVSITGGTVTATGGTFGPGIGAGYTGSFTSISITGGTVTATGGSNSAGLGGGWQADGVPVTIGAGANVTAAGAAGVTAVGGGKPASGEPETAFGSLSVAGTLTLPSGSVMTVPSGTTVSVTGTLANSGTLTLAGTIANTGSVVNHGTILVAGGTIDPAKVSDHNYLLTFDSANGDEQIQARVYAANLAAINQSAPAAPTRTGYTFTGWAAGGASWAATTTLSADTTVTAQWQRILAPFTSAAQTSISGTAAVGSPLIAEITTEAAPSPTSYSYQWYADGTAITDATDASFTPGVGQYDVGLTVTVTPVLEGYDSSTGDGTSAAATVVAGSFTGAAVIAVTGTPTVGQQLTAEVTTAAQPSPTSYSYQWYADGTAITDATDATFTPAGEQYDAGLTVTVTPVLEGYDSSTGDDTSAGVTVEEGVFTGSVDVSIVGLAQVGKTVTAVVTGALAPSPALAYAWYADGVELTGGALNTLTIPTRAAGATLTVQVTASLLGYGDVTALSTDVDVLDAPSASLSLADVTVGSTIVVSGEGFHDTGDLAVTLHSAPVLLGTLHPAIDGTVFGTFAIPAGTPAGQHHVVLTTADGTVVASLELTVAGAAALPATGPSGDVLGFSLVAMLMFAFGVIIVASRRRRV